MKKVYLICMLISMLFFHQSVNAQTMQVSGKVTEDATDEGLAGVNVIIQGTSTGTITDVDGNYTLEAPQGSTLVFSFVGYLTQSVVVNQQTINVVMRQDVTNLEEVVISGLASTVKRSNLANAVATVGSEQLTGTTTQQTLDNAMYGKIPGVNMNANGGAPGGGINVQLRGISTLGAGSSQPLYIIDGVYLDNSAIRSGRTQLSGASGGQSTATQDNAANRIADINPADIERIEVLKGPSAAAIYGTRANAGVIIITTKKGSTGAPKIRFTQDIGIAKGQNFIEFDDWNPDKIAAYYGTGAGGQAELAKYNEAVAEGRVTDWEEEIYGETAFLLNSQLSVTGGTNKTTYFISGGLQDEDGIIEGTGFERYSIRANIEQKLWENVTLNLNSNYIRSESDRGFTGNQNNTGGSMGYTIAYTPSYADLFPDEQGNYPNNDYFNDNPLAIRDLAENNFKVNRFITSFGLNWDILKTENSFLTFNMSGGIDYVSSESLVYLPEILQHQEAQANPGDVMWGKSNNFNSNIQGFLIFNTNLGSFNSTTQAGVVKLHQTSDFILNRGRGLAGGQSNLQWANVVSVQEQTAQEITDLGLVFQEELNWEEKIIGTVGVRFDKSTLNFQQNEFYAFPKASIAINLHNFDFWESSVVNQLKIRTAYGETGGLPTFGNTFESLTPQLIGGGLGGQVGTRGVDPDLVPETASEIEFGFDLGLFNNRVNLEATYYNKKVNDLILDLIPAESTGILAIATNAADLTNNGIELSLSATPIRTGNVEWFTQLLWWKNESEITNLQIPTFTTGGFGPSLGSYLIAEGYSPTTIIGTPAGTEIPGGFTVYGDRQANFDMSFYNSVTFFKNFSLSFLFHWKDGGSNINLSSLLWDDGGNTPGWDEDANNNDTPDGLDRLLEWSGGNSGVYIQPSSYVKLREIGLYYTVPVNLTDTFLNGAFNSIKVGVSGNNILLWTDYESYDPEVSNFGNQPISSNIEVAPFPSSRRYFFHLALEF
jgi:TonB-linked SusC/RagA family outer membrane protein